VSDDGVARDGNGEDREEDGETQDAGGAAGPTDRAPPPEVEATAAGPSVDDLRAERDRIKDQWLRTAADFDNFRKRTKRDVEDALRRGREDTVRELLPVIDNLERAMAAAQTATDVNAVIEGVQMVLRLFEDVGRRLGLERVAAVGARFDPNVHDAVQQQETSEHPPGTIVAEIAPGYRLGDRLLRAAMVTVARPPARPPEPGAQEGGEDPPSE
jgi:molecular chaperone GrpE